MIGYSFATANHVKSLRMYRLQLAIHLLEYNTIDAAMLTYMRTKISREPSPLVYNNLACYNSVYNNLACDNLVYNNLVCYNSVYNNLVCYNLVYNNLVCNNLVCDNLVDDNLMYATLVAISQGKKWLLESGVAKYKAANTRSKV